MAGRAAKSFATLAIVVVVASAIGAYFVNDLWTRIHAPYKGYQTGELFLEIPPGAGTGEIRRRLIDAGVVADDVTLRAALWWSGRSRALKAGEYRFDEPMTPLDVVEKIAKGDVYTKRLTFPEGLTIREMAGVYESHGFGPAREFEIAARNASLIKDLDPRATDLEGYLFPETYSLARVTPATRIVELMVERFRAVYKEVVGERPDPKIRELVTLASLVEKETAQNDERPLVAAVYRNRVRKGMGMQADPTVVYALMKAGRYDGNIRRADLDFDSPYNTYKYSGLPPGPIASPGRASLQAALMPADAPYLYFVSRNDGTHAFAETLAEHNANVQKWQVEYFRKAQATRGRGQGQSRPKS